MTAFPRNPRTTTWNRWKMEPPFPCLSETELFAGNRGVAVSFTNDAHELTASSFAHTDDPLVASSFHVLERYISWFSHCASRSNPPPNDYQNSILWFQSLKNGEREAKMLYSIALRTWTIRHVDETVREGWVRDEIPRRKGHLRLYLLM